MLIILAWHQILNRSHATPLKTFEKQLQFLKKEFSIIESPNIVKGNMNILLTFDDATIDFFAHVYPILQELKLPATIGIPTFWIQNSSDLSLNQRLSLLTSKNPFYQKECFCNWQELNLMKNSNLVHFAAHGHQHQRMDICSDKNEILIPKIKITENLSYTTNSFIFPYGRYSKKSLPIFRHNYTHLYRIGTAVNTIKNSPLLYRIVADQIEDLSSLFTKKSLLQLICKEWFNRFRGC